MKVIHLKVTESYYTILGDEKKYTNCPITLLHHYIDGPVEKFVLRYIEWRETFEYQLKKQPQGNFYGTAISLPNNEVFPDSSLSLIYTVDEGKYSVQGKYQEEDFIGEWFIKAEVDKKFEI